MFAIPAIPNRFLGNLVSFMIQEKIEFQKYLFFPYETPNAIDALNYCEFSNIYASQSILTSTNGY